MFNLYRMNLIDIFNIDNVLGKIIIIILIIITTYHHILLGIIVFLFFISLKEGNIEGMENNKSSKDSNTISPQNKFRLNNCENKKLLKQNKEITPKMIKQSFPNIKFQDDTLCNPCDLHCDFEIIDSNDKITNEQNLRPEDSKNNNINREDSIKKNN